MTLDPRIPLMGQPIQLNSPLNMLARAQGIQNMQQTNALNAMQMQDMRDQRTAQQQQAQAMQRARAEFPDPPPDAPEPLKLAVRAFKTGLGPFSAIQEAMKPVEMKAAAPGSTLYHPTTGQIAATVPDKPAAPDKPPSAVQEYEYAKGQGYQGSFKDWTTEKARAGASNVSVSTGQRGLDNTLKLRGEFKSEPIYKAHQEVQAAYSQIKESLKLASPAGDLAGATKIMKILDPGSVVRESELGMAMAASGLMDRMVNYAQMTLSGQKLTPTQRKDFQTLADALYSESVKQYNAKRGEYKGIADRNQLPEADVIGSEAKPANVGWGIVRVP